MRELVRRIATDTSADLRLATLARELDLSPYQLHRAFLAATDETLARFVERKRLEQAAHALLFHERSVLEIGLEHGYKSHETFTRAFRRRYGIAPKAFRQRGRWLAHQDVPDRAPDSTDAFALSATRVQRLRETPDDCADEPSWRNHFS